MISLDGICKYNVHTIINTYVRQSPDGCANFLKRLCIMKSILKKYLYVFMDI